MNKRVYSIAIIALIAITIFAMNTVPVIAGDGLSSILTNVGDGTTYSGSPELSATANVYLPLVMKDLSTRPKPEMVYSVNPAEAGLNDEVTYTLNVTNTGLAPAEMVIIKDTLSPYLDLRSVATTKGKYSSSTMSGNWSVEINALAPGEDVTITVVGHVNSTAISTTISNTALMWFIYEETLLVTSNPVNLELVIPATPTPTQPPILPTPTATATATTAPLATTGNVDITTIYYDGAGSSEPDEYVEIKNDDSGSIQLQNWTLSDAANHVFTFPSFVIEPSQTCRVYTNENHWEWCGFSYGSGSAIWNNSGDIATLKDSQGTVIDTYSY